MLRIFANLRLNAYSKKFGNFIVIFNIFTFYFKSIHFGGLHYFFFFTVNSGPILYSYTG